MKQTSPLERADRATPHTLLADVREFLDVHLPRLSALQRRTVRAWAEGQTCSEIARVEGVSDRAIQYRLRDAIENLRQLAAAG